MTSWKDYKLRLRESEKLKTVLELYNMEIHQKKLGPDYHRLKTMVNRSIEQEIRNKNFGSRIGNFEKNAVVKNGILQNASSTSQKMDAELVKSALTRIARLKNNWVAYFRIWSRRSLQRFLRKSSNIRKPIRCVRFTKAVLRHANIRDQNPSLGMICPGEPHQRNPNAPKFEDRSQEETEWQERCAREAAWRLAESIQKLNEKHENNILLTFGKLVSACAINP